MDSAAASNTGCATASQHRASVPAIRRIESGTDSRRMAGKQCTGFTLRVFAIQVKLMMLLAMQGGFSQ
jgi:hypothetical protein